jgi:alpha-glucosidase
MKRPAFAVLAAWLTLAGCSEPDVSRWTFGGGWEIEEADEALLIRRHGKAVLDLQAVHAVAFRPAVSDLFGFFRFGAEERTLHELPRRPAALGPTASAPLGVSTDAAGALRIRLARPADAQAVQVTFRCRTGDRFWGFGEQYDGVDMRGRDVDAWTAEQGVGRASGSPLPPIGRLTDSYFPMPWFLDPQRSYGVLVTSTALSRFDLCEDEPGEWRVEVWDDPGFELVVFAEDHPRKLVQALTAEVGRPASAPPSWALNGVWLAAQGGDVAVRERVAAALAAGIPVSAVWVQDWVGLRNFGLDSYGVKYRWNWDSTLYPSLPTMITEFAADGVRFLGYFNPFLVPGWGQWETAATEGWAVRDAAGEPALFPIVTFDGGLVDLTHPEAVQWFRGYADAAIELGMRGWMADFGEWLPYDATLHAGDARLEHNRYPTRWHKVNREALETAYPDGDFVLLTRSGFTGEHRVAQVVWAGDQEADWSRTDGLPTVVPAGLTLGLSGIPFFTHDVAGFSGGPSDGELFRRWTELGAFSPIMRTHDGLRKLENHRFDSDVTTMTHFLRMASIHAALGPVWRELAGEAVATGLPILRHTALVDPDWPGAFEAHQQWMIGDDLVFAPVVAPGRTTAAVDLPDGRWVPLWGGAAVAGRQRIVSEAPEGRPAVWLREGRWPEVAAAIRALD